MPNVRNSYYRIKDKINPEIIITDKNDGKITIDQEKGDQIQEIVFNIDIIPKLIEILKDICQTKGKS